MMARTGPTRPARVASGRRDELEATQSLGATRGEGVALADFAGLEAAAEPLDALRRGAVGEVVGHHAPLSLALQAVVPDGGGGAEGFVEVAFFQDVAGLVGVVGPDAGETVGLQLHPDRQRVGFPGVAAAANVLHALGDAEESLDVVADFVGNHVGLGEVTGSAEAIAEVAEEGRVEIELVVAGTVERSDGGAGHAAGRLDRAR